MKSQACRKMRLAEYVDGELSGVDRLEVSRHLERCPDCDRDAQEIQGVGELLRVAVAGAPAMPELAGLASGVISRTGAERAQSWRAMFDRAVEDWHWFLVGFGSVTAAFVSIAFVSAILQFGPAPEREDSVSALLSNPDWKVHNSPEGSLYVWAKPIPETDWKIMLSRRERDAAAAAALMVPASLAGAESDALAGALGDALGRSGLSPDGRFVDANTQRDADALFLSIKQQQTESRIGGDGIDRSHHGRTAGSHYHVQYVTNAEVTAKGN